VETGESAVVLRNADVTEIVAEMPEGHLHIRTTVQLADGSSIIFQEATVAAMVRAYVAVKTDPVCSRVVLKGRAVPGRKDGFAEWQLMEES
jgi:hypothetical protein